MVIDHQVIGMGHGHGQLVADESLQRGEEDAPLAAEGLVQAAAVQAGRRNKLVHGSELGQQHATAATPGVAS